MSILKLIWNSEKGESIGFSKEFRIGAKFYLKENT